MKNKVIQYKFRILGIIIWMLIWQIVSSSIGNDIFLPSPIDVILALSTMLQTKVFYLSALQTIEKISMGFFLAVFMGVSFALLSKIHLFFKEFILVFIRVIKSIPVVSFVILILLWLGPRNLSIFISFLMVLPVIYLNVFNGIQRTDQSLLEMAKVYKLSILKKIRYIYIPAIMPYFVSACSIGLGLCWKAGIAAEVIGLPKNSIGEQLYGTKLYLMTKEFFAWTIIIVIISAIFEKLVMMMIRYICKLLTGVVI